MTRSPDKTCGGAGTRASLVPAVTGQARNRRPGAGSVLATLAAVAIGITACSSGSSTAAATGGAVATQGTQQGQGGGLSGTPARHQSGIYSGTFTVAFALHAHPRRARLP